MVDNDGKRAPSPSASTDAADESHKFDTTMMNCLVGSVSLDRAPLVEVLGDLPAPEKGMLCPTDVDFWLTSEN